MERGEVKCGNIIILCEGHWVYSPLCVDAVISGPQIFLLVQNDSAGYISPHSSIALDVYKRQGVGGGATRADVPSGVHG